MRKLEGRGTAQIGGFLLDTGREFSYNRSPKEADSLSFLRRFEEALDYRHGEPPTYLYPDFFVAFRL